MEKRKGDSNICLPMTIVKARREKVLCGHCLTWTINLFTSKSGGTSRMAGYAIEKILRGRDYFACNLAMASCASFLTALSGLFSSG